MSAKLWSVPSIRHQVFLSSTYLDLQAERTALTQALLRMRQVIPAGMELFSADSRPPWGVITSILADTDYLVLVIAGRYGSVGEDGISYTEREYDYAIAHGIPVLAFVHAEPGALRADAIETTQTGKRALAAFSAKVEDAHTIQRWQTVDELVHAVLQALPNAFNDHPRPGWVRGSALSTTSEPPPAALALSGPQLRLHPASSGGRMLQTVTSSEKRVAAYVRAATDELLAELTAAAEVANNEAAYGQWPQGLARQQYDLSQVLRLQNSMNAALEEHHDEDRSEEEYRQEVARYGEDLESALHRALDDAAAHVLVSFAPTITNMTERNYERVRVELHVEGDVRALEPADEDVNFDPLVHLPRRPRKWGPWTTSKLAGMLPQVDYMSPSFGELGSASFGSSVEIENGGSTTLRYDPVHLRPRASESLDPVVLIVSEGAVSPLRATWQATATNVDGQTRGEVEVPVEGDVVDLWDVLGTST